MSLRQVIEAAAGKWPEILKAFGLPEACLKNAHGPCPICKGKDRFRFDNKEGTGSYFCSHCGSGYGFKLLSAFTGRTQKDLAEQVGAMVGNLTAAPVRPVKDMRRKISWITKNLLPVAQVPEVAAYLRGRGLKSVQGLGALPAERYYEDGKVIGTFPVLVATFYAPDGQLVTYHLTFVHNGQKAPVSAPKKLLTPLACLDGGALRLTRPYASLGIAEGVETALAVMRDFNVPCWAAYSAGMLEKFTPPAGVEAVTIYGDNDRSFAGQKAAFALAQRLNTAGIRAEVKLPDYVGDFADRKASAA